MKPGEASFSHRSTRSGSALADEEAIETALVLGDIGRSIATGSALADEEAIETLLPLIFLPGSIVAGSALADEEAIETVQLGGRPPLVRRTGSALADEEAIETSLCGIRQSVATFWPAVPWPMRRPLKPNCFTAIGPEISGRQCLGR